MVLQNVLKHFRAFSKHDLKNAQEKAKDTLFLLFKLKYSSILRNILGSHWIEKPSF